MLREAWDFQGFFYLTTNSCHIQKVLINNRGQPDSESGIILIPPEDFCMRQRPRQTFVHSNAQHAAEGCKLASDNATLADPREKALISLWHAEFLHCS